MTRSDLADQASQWLTASEALDLFAKLQPSARGFTGTKFLIGATMADVVGCSVEKYNESIWIADEPSRREQYTGNIPDDFWPREFWVLGHALDADAFRRGSLVREETRLACELPYRWSKRFSADQQDMRCVFRQEMSGLEFCRSNIELVLRERTWKRYCGYLDPQPASQGRRRAWVWDQAKAWLVVEAARRPELVRSGTRALANLLAEQIFIISGSWVPDQKDLVTFSKEISRLIRQIESPDAPID